MPRVPRGLVAACALVSLVLAGCASPAWNGASYQGKAIRSAKEMSSVVATADLAARLHLDGKLPTPAADTTVSSAEQDAQGVLAAFESRQPPGPGSRQLFEHVDPILQQAASDVTDLRMALRADDRAGMTSALDHLGAVQPKLRSLAGAS